MTTVRTVAVWWAVTLGSLCVLYAAWYAAARWGERRAAARLARDRAERQERYAAAAMAQAMQAARLRHPTAPRLRPVQGPMPAAEVDRLLAKYQDDLVRLFKADIKHLRDEDWR